MSKALPRELLTLVDNIDFWAMTEITPSCNRRELLDTLEELSDRARRMAGAEEQSWLESRLQVIRSRIDRRIGTRPLEELCVSAASKARRKSDMADGSRLSP